MNHSRKALFNLLSPKEPHLVATGRSCFSNLSPFLLFVQDLLQCIALYDVLKSVVLHHCR
jgi:hypothetical protein